MSKRNFAFVFAFLHSWLMETKNLIGGVWLTANYGIKPVMPLQTLSRLGGRRATQVSEGILL